MNLRITGSKQINASFKDSIKKVGREFGTINLKIQQDDGYGLNCDSIEDSVEEFIEN